MLKRFSLLIIIVVFNIFLFNTVNAAGTIGSGTETTSCPKIVQYDSKTGQYTLVSTSKIYNEFTNVTNNSTNNADSQIYYVNGVPYSRSQLLRDVGSATANLSCPPSIAELQTLFLRIVGLVNSIIGLVLFYVIAKASIIRMTARSNPDAVKKSNGMFISAISGLGIVLGAYIGLILLGTRLLAPTDCARFSFVDSGKTLIFWFDQSDISPVLVPDGSNPACTLEAIKGTK